MEGISGGLRKGLKEYWRRRGYQRLNGSGGRRRNRVEPGSTRTHTHTQTRRRWRIKMVPRIRIPRIRIGSPKKLVLWLRDAYVRMMLGLASSRVISLCASSSGYGGNTTSIAMAGLGRAPPKEYDEKMIIQIYKSLMMAQPQLVPRVAAPTCTSPS